MTRAGLMCLAFLFAASVSLGQTTIVDDGDVAFSLIGENWHHRTDEGAAYGGDIHHISPGCGSGGTGAREARWSFAVPNVPAAASITWTAYANRATNTPVSVLDSAGRVLTSTILNQQIPPSGETANGKVFQAIGTVQTAGGSIVIRMTDAADGCIVADAVRVVVPLATSWVTDNLHVASDALASQVRGALIGQIWKDAGLPTRLADAVTLNIGTTDLAPPSPLPNLSSVDRYAITTAGNTVRPFLLNPTQANGQLAVIGLGHTLTGNLQGLTETTKLVAEALSRGNVVLFVPMPDGGMEQHDALGSQVTPAFHPMRLFLEPAIVSLNQYLATHSPPSVIVGVGISGGGWMTVLLAAIDTRIQASYPVAGSLPLVLRESANTSDWGDWEQRLPELTWNGIQPLEYLDLYLMGASDGRTQVQINNQSDTCCFAGTRQTAYAPTLTAANPRWTFYQDNFAGHGIGTSLSAVVGPAFGTPPSLPQTRSAP